LTLKTINIKYALLILKYFRLYIIVLI